MPKVVAMDVKRSVHHSSSANGHIKVMTFWSQVDFSWCAYLIVLPLLQMSCHQLESVPISRHGKSSSSSLIGMRHLSMNEASSGLEDVAEFSSPGTPTTVGNATLSSIVNMYREGSIASTVSEQAQGLRTPSLPSYYDYVDDGSMSHPLPSMHQTKDSSPAQGVQKIEPLERVPLNLIQVQAPGPFTSLKQISNDSANGGIKGKDNCADSQGESGCDNEADTPDTESVLFQDDPNKSAKARESLDVGNLPEVSTLGDISRLLKLHQSSVKPVREFKVDTNLATLRSFEKNEHGRRQLSSPANLPFHPILAIVSEEQPRATSCPKRANKSLVVLGSNNPHRALVEIETPELHATNHWSDNFGTVRRNTAAANKAAVAGLVEETRPDLFTHVTPRPNHTFRSVRINMDPESKYPHSPLSDLKSFFSESSKGSSRTMRFRKKLSRVWERLGLSGHFRVPRKSPVEDVLEQVPTGFDVKAVRGKSPSESMTVQPSTSIVFDAGKSLRRRVSQ